MNGNIKLAFDPPPRNPLEKIFDLVVLQSWWVYLFAAVAYLLFTHGMQKKKVAVQEITQRLESLSREKKAALEENEELLLQINSQQDPAYIQMVLMKRLGLVPEGQIKVHFQENN